MALDFISAFLPMREESAHEYFIPQYSDTPIEEFDNANDLMTFLESNTEYSQRIYWRNMDENNPNKHGMIFYTKDGNMIFGISRNADTSGELNTGNEGKCLNEMKEYFNTEMGYIDYENPAVGTYDEFVAIVNELKNKSRDNT